MNRIFLYNIITIVILASFSCTVEEDKLFDSITFPDEIHFDKFSETQIQAIKA
ncbi:MAG TPA: hypothetical protein VLQ91_04660 [Draconibacterium sp.]|nr:hypothetical protein [Draconibacterium sp.]